MLKLSKEVIYDLREGIVFLYQDNNTFVLEDRVSIEIFKGFIESEYTTKENIYKNILGKFDCSDHPESKVKEYIDGFIESLALNKIITPQGSPNEV